MGSRLSVFDNKRSPSADGSILAGNRRNDSVIGLPAARRESTALIAPPAVEEVDVRIFREVGLHAGRHILSITTGADRGADKFCPYRFRLRVAEVRLQICHPV